MMIIYLLKYYLETKLFALMPEKWVANKQLRKFKKTFEWARENSDFYNNLYAKAGVANLKIESINDIAKVPIIDKELMNKSNIKTILTCKQTDKLVITNTSGSTGVPIDIYSTKAELFTGYVRTFIATKFYNPFKPYGFIGLYEHKEAVEKHTFIYYLQKHLGLFRRETFSVFTPPAELIQQLKAKNINVLFSTPSGLKVLIAKLKEKNDRLRFRVVVVSGETLSEDLRTDIKRYLDAKVIDVYGCMEHPSLSWTDPNGDFFNYPSNSVYVEYINKMQIEGEWYGELVITNLANKTMPFVRYKIGDRVKILDSNKRMGKISGRVDDIIEYENGDQIFMIQLYPFDAIFDYSQYKVIQKKDKSVYFQAVCNSGVDKDKLKRRIESVWKECFGNNPVVVEFVKDLPINSKTGKFKLIEREV
ncbi:AMP-binding protein [uncultured Draconibacterium sp.]|uniref:phenylacetate--CoA ligase family protein n=1 Tax=uncultured Draconibacterium sp. TaxID=1573823 RepID=UPI0032612684